MTGQPHIHQKALLKIWCEYDHETTPHSDLRVITRLSSTAAEVSMRCNRCGRMRDVILSPIPEGYRLFDIVVHAAPGPDWETGFPLPADDESFQVLALSLREAYNKAQFAKEIDHRGRVLSFFVNGVSSDNF